MVQIISFNSCIHLTVLPATAECFARISHRRGVRLFVLSSHCGIVSKRCKL